MRTAFDPDKNIDFNWTDFMSTLHLIYGPQGAGKSTLARALVAKHRAVYFAIDDWMIQLFGPDLPQPPDMAWLMARVQRCEARIWSTAFAVLAQGSAVILDIGMMKRAQREDAETRVRENGFAAEWHFVNAPLEVRRARVAARNLEKGETFAFEVSPIMFDIVEAQFEPPSEDERKRASITDVA